VPPECRGGTRPPWFLVALVFLRGKKYLLHSEKAGRAPRRGRDRAARWIVVSAQSYDAYGHVTALFFESEKVQGFSYTSFDWPISDSAEPRPLFWVNSRCNGIAARLPAGDRSRISVAQAGCYRMQNACRSRCHRQCCELLEPCFDIRLVDDVAERRCQQQRARVHITSAAPSSDEPLEQIMAVLGPECFRVVLDADAGVGASQALVRPSNSRLSDLPVAAGFRSTANLCSGW